MRWASLFLTQHKKRFGFTIVELLIVIVVIAILAAITVIAYNGISARATNASIESSLQQASKKLAIYRIDNDNLFPRSASDAGIITANTGYTINYASSPDGSQYCFASSKSGRTYFISNTTNTPTTGICNNSSGVVGTGDVAIDGPSTSFSSIFSGQTPPGAYSVWNDGNGSLQYGNRFYTSNANGISVIGMRIWNPSNADTAFLAQSLTARAYTNDWIGANLSANDSFLTTPRATKVYATQRSAGTWTDIMFDTPFALPRITNTTGSSDLLTLSVQFNSGTHYVFGSPTPNSSLEVESTSTPGTYLAEDTHIGRGVNTIAPYGAVSSYYGIDLIFNTIE